MEMMEMVPGYIKGASNNGGHSEYIYYCATDEEVREFRSKFSDSEMTAHAESSKAAHEKTHEAQSEILSDVKAVSNAVRSSSQHSCCGGEVKQELDHLKELVEKLVRLQTNNPPSQQ
jgi:hypothetical protein